MKRTSLFTGIRKLYMVLAMALVLAMAVPAAVTLPGNATVEAASRKSHVRISKSKVTLKIGKSYRLKVSGTKAKVRWISKNKKVATVSSKGVIKARKAGKAVIIARVGKKNLKCVVTVPKNGVNLQKTVSYRGICVTAKVQNRHLTLTIRNNTGNAIKTGLPGNDFYLRVNTSKGVRNISEDVLQSLWNTNNVNYQIIPAGSSFTYTMSNFNLNPKSITLMNIYPLNGSLPVFDWGSFSYISYNITIKF